MKHTLFKIWIIAILVMILLQAVLISRQINLMIEIIMEPISIQKKELQNETTMYWR